ncbi:PLC-like phosphodiesterase [Diaporthe sp. PMI_573]|nr:PLC-like phosphodiesterase [Diaporthaceae sp. PMI_573]
MHATLASTHSTFGDIPYGRARQNVAHYTEEVGKNPVDDSGEAYYNIGNTGKKFVIRVTTHIPDTYPYRVVFDLTGMDKGQREYKVPGQEVPVTLNEIKHRRLIMPGTHNAGMSELSTAILSGAASSNAQNQLLNVYDQLRVGSRWFDLRVSSVHQVPVEECCGDYEFWISHLSKELEEVPIGRSGEKFDRVIDEINKFTGENPGEVIVLQFRYLVGIRNVPSHGPIYWDDNAKNNFFDKLRRINNRYPNLGTSSIEQLKMGTLMNFNNGKGCVLIFLDTEHLKYASEPLTLPMEGIYKKDGMKFYDAWPQLEGTQEVAEWAVTSWKKKDQFHVAQWLVTPDHMTSTFAYGLQEIAILPTNPALYWRGVDEISPKVFPNVLMVDYIGMVLMNEPQWDALSAELYTLAIGINLYTVSENCDINKRRSPLLPPTTKSLVMPSHPLVSNFNGIIFANGTTIDNPPPGFHPGRVEVFRNGTEFSNGTVLATDVPNPDFNSTSV